MSITFVPFTTTSLQTRQCLFLPSQPSTSQHANQASITTVLTRAIIPAPLTPPMMFLAANRDSFPHVNLSDSNANRFAIKSNYAGPPPHPHPPHAQNHPCSQRPKSKSARRIKLASYFIKVSLTLYFDTFLDLFFTFLDILDLF